MKRTCTILTLLCLLYLLLALLPVGAGMWGVLASQLRFLLPAAAVPLLLRRQGEENVSGPRLLPRLSPGPLLILPIFLGGTMLLALLSSVVSEALGIAGGVPLPEGKGLPYLLTVYALLPALCEELLCRYAMLKLLLPHSRPAAIWISATLFACLHMNAVQFPYALFAGVMLAWVTVATDSIATAFLFHLLNNALSVLLFYFNAPPQLSMLLFGGMLAAAVLCALLLYALRNRPGLRATVEVWMPDPQAGGALREALFSPLPLFVIFSFVIILL